MASPVWREQIVQFCDQGHRATVAWALSPGQMSKMVISNEKAVGEGGREIPASLGSSKDTRSTTAVEEMPQWRPTAESAGSPTRVWRQLEDAPRFTFVNEISITESILSRCACMAHNRLNGG